MDIFSYLTVFLYSLVSVLFIYISYAIVKHTLKVIVPLEKSFFAIILTMLNSIFIYIVVAILENEIATNIHNIIKTKDTDNINNYKELLKVIKILLTQYIPIPIFFMFLGLLILIIINCFKYSDTNKKELIGLILGIISVAILFFLIHYSSMFITDILLKNPEDFVSSNNINNVIKFSFITGISLTVIITLIDLLKTDYQCSTSSVIAYSKYMNLIIIFSVLFGFIMYSYATKDISWIKDFIDKIKDPK